ncbi:MAG: prepilin-type N-terminal cleavage/methylation domain-containing protein [Dehalococcoidia bacterium]|nr:prepilin-type N-terminal cleavage/methylation domain-containing protein [Dehalococcoidia bacterium]
MRSTDSIHRRLTILQGRAVAGASVRSRVALRSQSGLTLIELLIAIAIIGAMGAAAVGATFQLLNASRQSTDGQLAITQVRSVEHWITRDTLTSQAISPNLVNPSGFPLVLAWQSIDGTSNSVTYTMVDSPSSSLKLLQRDAVNGGATATTIVGEYIDASLTSCTYSGTVLTVTVAATAREYTATRTFEAKPRSDAPPT